MIDMSIKVEGVDNIVRKLGRAAAPTLMRKPMARSMIMLQGDMATYPPQRPASTYRRTGSLGRKWTYAIVVTGDSISGRLGNNLIYAPRVQSKRFQAAVHRQTGWPTDEDVLARRTPAIIRIFEQDIRVAVHELGL